MASDIKNGQFNGKHAMAWLTAAFVGTQFLDKPTYNVENRE